MKETYDWDLISAEEKEIEKEQEKTKKEIQELKKKLNELEGIKEEQEVRHKKYIDERNMKKIAYIKKHKDVILPLFSHSRRSCSDANPCNSLNDCPRCYLIKLANDELYPEKISFYIVRG